MTRISHETTSVQHNMSIIWIVTLWVFHLYIYHVVVIQDKAALHGTTLRIILVVVGHQVEVHSVFPIIVRIVRAGIHVHHHLVVIGSDTGSTTHVETISVCRHHSIHSHLHKYLLSTVRRPRQKVLVVTAGVVVIVIVSGAISGMYIRHPR